MHKTLSHNSVPTLGTVPNPTTSAKALRGVVSKQASDSWNSPACSEDAPVVVLLIFLTLASPVAFAESRCLKYKVYGH